jgi:hypothetical protein
MAFQSSRKKARMPLPIQPSRTKRKRAIPAQ